MTVGATFAFPESRPVGAWWKQLAPLRPQALWVAHLLLHRIEAPVLVNELRRPDPFTLAVLEAVMRNQGQPAEAVDNRLHLGPQVTLRALRALEAESLASADHDGRWWLTELGRSASQHQVYAHQRVGRRVFHFLEKGGGGDARPYLKLSTDLGEPWPAGDGWQFDLRWLETCLQRPAEWKVRHGFPVEVVGIPGLDPPEGGNRPGTAEWQRVSIDRPTHQTAVLVLVPESPSPAGSEVRPGDGCRLLGFAVRPENWSLVSDEPAFALEGDWAETMPELLHDPSLEQWRRAWREWAHKRGLADNETGRCALERHQHSLRVTAPERLFEQLRSTRSDALKGEAWVLAGENRLRTAALLEITRGARTAPKLV